MTKRKGDEQDDPDTESTGRAGVHAVGAIIEGKLRWAFREQPVNDYGIDAHVEAKSDEGPSGRLIALQIKAGSRYFREQTAHGVVYRGSLKHLAYWERHSLPVVLVLHEPEANRAIWQVVTKDSITTTKKGWKMVIPFKNRLDTSCMSAWSTISEGPPYQRRLRALVLAKPWMNIILEGRRLLLEVEEWINKSSGRGSMKLLSQDDDANEETIESWPSLMFPGAVYQELIPHLFPWADVAIDDEFYESYDEAAHDGECAIYSEGEFMCHTEDYGEWRKRLPRFRPYEVVAGEVAHFRLELTISALGEGFLLLDDYLDSGNVPMTPSHLLLAPQYASGLKAITARLGVGGNAEGHDDDVDEEDDV